MRLVLVVLLVVFSGNVLAQYSISGKITGADNEAVVGANVLLLPDSLGAVSTNNGLYQLTAIKPGNYTLRVSHVQYKTVTRPLNLKKDIVLNFSLEENEDMLKELDIIADNPQLQAINSVKISTKSISLAPVPFL